MACSPSASMFIDVNEDQDQKTKRTKVTIVGVGQVGMAAAFSIMMQGHANHIALVDVVADKLKGEMLDLQHGQQFLRPCTISADTDYSISAGSKIVIVTAGARQREGESRLNLVQRNVAIFKGIIPKIVQHSPDCILVIVSNPVDILTYVAWKVSGLPRNRVIGTGTMLDSARFRFQLGQRLNVDPKSCHGYIVGEHGDSSVAVWSSLNVGGVNLSKLNPNIGSDKDPEHYADVHKEVVQSAYEIIKLKGYTSWAIGLTVSTLVGTILRDQHSILALSVYAKGVYGITDEVFLSLPSVVTGHGISRVIGQTLNEVEEKNVRESAKTLHEIINGIQW